MSRKPQMNANTRESKNRKSASIGVHSRPLAVEKSLFDRVAAILEQARGNVVRAVNTNMVLAYWLIGREIVLDLQGGEERAEYGEKMLADLSIRLAQRYGNGFSVPNLQNFRKFYLAYRKRVTMDRNIQYPVGTKSVEGPIQYPAGTKSTDDPIPHPPGRELPTGFFSQLSWSHYRALMRVEDPAARDFYEREAAECGWSKSQLERQIHTAYYQRILANRGSKGLVAANRDRLPGEPVDAGQMLKAPYVLEFLGLPDAAALHESELESAIITHLQRFLLELGNGFAFVARQKHIRIEEDDRFIDLVFYHCRLKFYLLIDLKVGELTHADVGQMDGYVRMYDALFTAPDDNPTIGLILCTEKNETVARYSVLNDRRQIFASKYMLCLPTEEQLRLEIEKERHLIEAAAEEGRRDDTLSQGHPFGNG